MKFKLDPAWNKKLTLKNLLLLPVKTTWYGRTVLTLKSGKGTPINKYYSKKK